MHIIIINTSSILFADQLYAEHMCIIFMLYMCKLQCIYVKMYMLNTYVFDIYKSNVIYSFYMCCCKWIAFIQIMYKDLALCILIYDYIY